jgi:hypothetical protein
MESLLKGWVDRGETPGDYYALLGKPRFHRERDELLAAVRAGYRFLQGYQCDAARRKFAAKLQLQLAAAGQVFEDDAAWKTYDESLTTRPAASSVETVLVEAETVDLVPAQETKPAASVQTKPPVRAVSRPPAAPKARSHPVLPALPRPGPPALVAAPKPVPPPVQVASRDGMKVAWLVVGVVTVTAVVFGAMIALAAIGWALMSSPRPVRTTWVQECVAVVDA